MKLAIFKGFGFGLTSGVITTLGMIIGLYATTESKFVVISGILSIAIADSVSDALGIHLSEESDTTKSSKHIWIATLSTFLSKFIITVSFILPILLFNLNIAILISIIWGIFLVSIYSFKIAIERSENPYKAIFEHILIMSIVLTIVYFTGKTLSMIE
ncbi:membrane protein [Sulfurihydrogenibium subterraneum]|uniref:membrane protein n=1 Tax=Sulfurihydrogenibium subterraneum TaxID=171121 RepID=UPI00048CE0F9|nr:membrane protein [Sulfurihydrogenibium subterraneum]